MFTFMNWRVCCELSITSLIMLLFHYPHWSFVLTSVICQKLYYLWGWIYISDHLSTCFIPYTNDQNWLLQQVNRKQCLQKKNHVIWMKGTCPLSSKENGSQCGETARKWHWVLFEPNSLSVLFPLTVVSDCVDHMNRMTTRK